MIALLAPLFLLLPNIGRLRFIDFTDYCSGFEEIVDLAAGDYPGKILSKLEVIELIRSEAPRETEIQSGLITENSDSAFYPWLNLPSVRTLRAENGIWTRETRDCPSHITAIELINCSVEPRSIQCFLSRCRSLKRFAYDWRGNEVGNIALWSGFFRLLTSSGSDSLEYLRITGRMPPVNRMMQRPTLRDLARLKQAHISLDFFIDMGEVWEHECVMKPRNHQEPWPYQRGSDVLPFHEFFPPSIEEITISVRDEMWTLAGKLLTDLIFYKSWMPYFIKLKSVVFETKNFTAEDFEKHNGFCQPIGTMIGVDISFR